jgi:hypothetical protein
MNETVFLRFTRDNQPLAVTGFHPDTGIEFEHHGDVSPLVTAIGVQPLLPAVLKPVQQRHDWRDNQFLLDARLEDGGILFSGAGGDPEGLPASVYDLTVEVESVRFENGQQRVTVQKNRRTAVVLNELPEKRRLRLWLDNVDDGTQSILNHAKSKVDEAPLTDWLKTKEPRLARKACLLNVLAKLRVPPAPSAGFRKPLGDCFQYVYFADVDRVYAAADGELVGRLEKLVDRKFWVAEGAPKAPIHERLKQSLTTLGIAKEDADRFALSSFRQGGRNSLQIVVATPPDGFDDPTVYTDVDIDLGNPLWDLEGLFVHLGELLDTGRTDHLALYRRLKDSDASDFLYYEVVGA